MTGRLLLAIGVLALVGAATIATLSFVQLRETRHDLAIQRQTVKRQRHQIKQLASIAAIQSDLIGRTQKILGTVVTSQHKIVLMIAPKGKIGVR